MPIHDETKVSNIVFWDTCNLLNGENRGGGCVTAQRLGWKSINSNSGAKNVKLAQGEKVRTRISFSVTTEKTARCSNFANMQILRHKTNASKLVR